MTDINRWINSGEVAARLAATPTPADGRTDGQGGEGRREKGVEDGEVDEEKEGRWMSSFIRRKRREG